MRIALLTYINRSGSTLLSQLLSKNPEILVFPEANVLKQLLLEKPHSTVTRQTVKNLQRALPTDKRLKHWGIAPDFLQEKDSWKGTHFDLFVRVLNEYAHRIRQEDTTIGLFKNNGLFNCYNALGERLRNERGIKFISIVRDPRAVFYSQKRAYRQRMGHFTANPLITSHSWNWFIDQTTRVQSAKDVHVLRYEELVTDTVTSLQQLYGFLDLDHTDLFLDQPGNLYDRIAPEQKALHSRIREKPDPKRISRWRDNLKDREIGLIEKVCSENIKEVGYRVSHSDEKTNHPFWENYLKLRIVTGMDRY